MTTADAIMFSVVGVSAVAAWRTPAPIVLLIWWGLGMAIWAVAEEPAPVEVSFSLDLVAFAVVLAVANTRYDRLAAALFVPTWAAYWLLDGMALWWASWGLGLAQFILVSVGAFFDFQRERPIRARLADWRRRQMIRRGMRFAPC